ncbi:trypsin-like peptidase domain-containing protein [Streptomyces sp. NPDC058108]|uniref:VMAP-C domain-containing protein n=1 Tax=Streptomyces sp. NPDC058108 TaxID=3346344 RepID=UPI0036E7A38E
MDAERCSGDLDSLMGSQSWQVRVSAYGIGSGFLVTDRHVMTCAHVVDGAERAEVTFAQYPDLGPLEATVIAGGGWSGADQGRGDVAVLELDRPVGVPPARFAAVDASYAHPVAKLTAYGFPRGYDEGILGEFRSTSDQLIAGEWLQLEAWTSHGSPLEEGFSGAAVVREDTGEVVGMVTARYSAGGGGRMLPSRALVRYWPDAAALVPVPDHSPGAVARLRDLVQRYAEDCTPEDVYRSVMEPLTPLPPLPPAGDFLSLWDVAWFLLTEVNPMPGTAPWADFAAYLADRAQDADVRRALYAWAGDHRMGTTRQRPKTRLVPDGVTKWSPILVEIERSGADRDTYMVSVYAIRGGRAQLVASNTLARQHMQEYVRERLDHAFRQLDRSGDELIAFALPRDWLAEPVDEWHAGVDDATPLGCSSPVVVMDLARRRESRLQFKLEKVWQKLDGRSSTDWHLVKCGSPEDPAKLTVRLRGLETAVGYGSPPETDQARGLLQAGLNAAAPVIVWPRSSCSSRHDGDSTAEHSCTGARFLDALEGRLASLPLADLPLYVRDLRSEAYLTEEPHWAAGLALIWEDPRWFPAASIYSQSPVG